MILSNFRMSEGYYPQYAPYEPADPFGYFRHFNPYASKAEMSEDHLEASPAPPASPNSTQSDSENSVCSVEIPRKELRLADLRPIEAAQQVQCRWRSCSVVFTTLDQLAAHVSKVHSSSGLGGLFYCGWEGCTRNDKGFNARYKMLVHVRTHTNEKPHKCLQCEKSFSRAENLKIHSRSHSGEKPYVCPVAGCGKAYSNSSDRFKHTRTHQVDKPYQCKVPGCPKRYTDPSSLRKHVKTYKHFVGEGRKVELEASLRENVIRHPCDCSRMCCVSSRSELFKIGNLIDIKEMESEKSTWGSFADPIVLERSKIYKPYEDAMQVDGPLDLSLHRRDF
ncbi:unnamed protein product [Phyllotreta striolata]|uniref:C2H2-type domain-containing protein n=1 Tax=Phyllotreta striolata TaxID=444603 RepID=A0A9N9THC6_PHYSR|nr:unnamed protein product [Phyllotreta striolata]